MASNVIIVNLIVSLILRIIPDIPQRAELIEELNKAIKNS